MEDNLDDNVTTVGTHVLINLYDVDDTLLKNIEIGKTISDKIVDELQLHVLEKTGHQFQPQGYTLLYLLSESHYSIHTYPEFNSCCIDIFCCNKGFNAKYAISVVRTLFCTKNVYFHIIPR